MHTTPQAPDWTSTLLPAFLPATGKHVWAQTPPHQRFNYFTFSAAERRVSVGAEHEAQAKVKLAVRISSIPDSHSATGGNQEPRLTEDTGAYIAHLSLCSSHWRFLNCHALSPAYFCPQGCWLSEATHCTHFPHATISLTLSFNHSVHTGNVNLGLQPQSLLWAPKYHLPGCPTTGWSLHSDVPTVPHTTLPQTVPTPRFPNPTERTVTHSPGTFSGNPGLCPLLFLAASSR